LAFAGGCRSGINSDARRPGELGVDFERALSLVGAVGYRTGVRFKGRVREVELFPESWPIATGAGRAIGAKVKRSEDG